MEQPKKLVNWIEVSRLFANNDTSISKNRYPKKYKELVEGLITTIDTYVKENVQDTQIEYFDWSVLSENIENQKSA